MKISPFFNLNFEWTSNVMGPLRDRSVFSCFHWESINIDFIWSEDTSENLT